MEFRQIRHGSDDYRQAKQLRNAVLRLPLRLILTVDDLMGEEDQMHFGAFDRDLLIGTVTMKPISSTNIRLRQMAISPSHQGKGVGAQLVAYAEKFVKALGFTMVETNAREVAENFYARQGYTAEGETFIDHTLPHRLMRKALK